MQRASRAAHEGLRVLLHEETQDLLAPQGRTAPAAPEPTGTKQPAAAFAPPHAPRAQGAAATAAEGEAAQGVGAEPAEPVELQAAGRINREQSAEEVVTTLRGKKEKAPAFGAAAAWNYRR